MGDLLVSAAVLGAVVLLSEATRRAAARLLPAGLRLSALEAASTFQLCSCTHELKLLADSSRLDAPLGLSLCFLMTVVHILSFREATCNPCAALERLVRGRSSLLAALVLVGLQFGAAVAAQSFASCVWSLGLSAVHAQHRRFGFRCFDPLGGSLLEAAAAELGCAFCVHAAAMHAHKLDEKLRVPFMAAVITALVYTGVFLSCSLTFLRSSPVVSDH